MPGPNSAIGVVDQTAAGQPQAVPVATSLILQVDNTTSQRQQMVLADPFNPAQLFSPSAFLLERQDRELVGLSAFDGSLNAETKRHFERRYHGDRRGTYNGRGASR